ncbi:MAG: metallophosphoesterase [Deltaproteobacteria bacterium]|nr:MAG: metallophosphoesterase [Deltaproteobacteria bacterium]
MKFVHTADTHLGFEITRVKQSDPGGRGKRADAIYQNFLRIVEHTVEIEADLFMHCGDLFNKYYIPKETLDELVRPIFNLSKAGTRVLLIPGNHERSEFPFDLFHGAKGVFVFDQPKTLSFEVSGYTVGIAGFPFIRQNSKTTFHKALEQTEYKSLRTDLNILMTHQAFDTASVGPVDFVFRASRPDTVSRNTVPLDFDYIAAGHIHRYQILDHPMKPGLNFVYPGSTQRISFAEMNEEKGFVEGELLDNRIETRLVPLPTYEMEIVEIEAAGLTIEDCSNTIRSHFWRFDEERVIRFKLTGGKRAADYPAIDLERIRMEMPPVLECQFVTQVGSRWVAA